MIQMMRSLYHQQEQTENGHRLSSADVVTMHAEPNACIRNSALF